MIKVKTKCSECSHKDVCKFEGDVDALKQHIENLMFGNGPNDDYDIKTMADLKYSHIDLEFTCKLYSGIRPHEKNVRTDFFGREIFDRISEDGR